MRYVNVVLATKRKGEPGKPDRNTKGDVAVRLLSAFMSLRMHVCAHSGHSDSFSLRQVATSLIQFHSFIKLCSQVM